MARRDPVRRRFWVETALAAATGLLAVITLLSKDWIETVFGIDPDEGSGALEWALVLTLLAVTVILGVVARQEWRRPASA